MNLDQLSVTVNAGIFLGAAIAVWIAGTKLARYADAIAEKTGMGREFLGIMLLGGVTSLPELAVATTATLRGAPALSVNDVLGSAAVNVIILAVADAISGKKALTAVQGSPLLMLQGVLGILLLAFAAAPALTGDSVVLGAGMWSWAMLATYIIAVRLIARSNANDAWRAAHSEAAKDEAQSKSDQRALRPVIVRTVIAGGVILVAGFLLASSGEALAHQTGLGTSFFGAVFLAFATSLPEWSTVISATRIGRYEMAISDVFGTNLFNVTILVFVDVLHRGGPVMVEAGSFAAFAALLALTLTGFYMIGMLERRDRSFLRMGWDSLAVIATYGAGVAVLHGLR